MSQKACVTVQIATHQTLSSYQYHCLPYVESFFFFFFTTNGIRQYGWCLCRVTRVHNHYQPNCLPPSPFIMWGLRFTSAGGMPVTCFSSDWVLPAVLLLFAPLAYWWCLMKAWPKFILVPDLKIFRLRSKTKAVWCVLKLRFNVSTTIPCPVSSFCLGASHWG